MKTFITCCLWAISFLTQPLLSKAQTFQNILGPMGTVRCILMPNSAECYLGSSSKGVFRSTDGGQTWSGLGGNTIMTGRINDLEQLQTGQLVAATEQGGIKIWDGTAWTNLSTGLPIACGINVPIRALVKGHDGQLYAGAHAYFPCFSTGDLYRLEGSTWVSIASGMGNTNVNTLAIHPVSGALYAGTEAGVFRFEGSSWQTLPLGLANLTVHKLVFNPAGDLYAGTDVGVSKLTNGSNNWQNLNIGLAAEPVYSIAIGQDPAQIILGTGFSAEQKGPLEGQIFVSTDAGQHWAPAVINGQTTVVNDLAWASDTQCLAVGWGIFASTDQGQNWHPSNLGFSAQAFTSQGRLAVSTTPFHTLFYGTDNGVFRSDDAGQTWKMSSKGLSRQMVTLLKTDHFGNIFCGVMRYLGDSSNGGFGDGVLYKSSDNGNNWAPVQISKDWRYMEMSELSNGDLICAHGFGAQPPSATYSGSSLARSTDHGDTWVDLPVQSGMAFCCAANTQGDLFVAGESQSVYRSTNGGTLFELVVAPGQSGNVGVLEVSPTGDIIMGAGGTRGMYFSSDNGASYQTFDSPVLPDFRGPSDVVFDDTGKAYCTTSGQGGAPSLFTISPPFSSASILEPVPGLFGSLFKMAWDDCGFLYIYRAGGILKSATALRTPEPSCASWSEEPATSRIIVDIFPNPTTGLLRLKESSQEVKEITLYNFSGQCVAVYPFQQELQLDLAAYPHGIYLLKASNMYGASQWFKVIKF